MAVKPCPRKQQFRELPEPAIPVRRRSVQRLQQQPPPHAHFRPRPWLFSIPIVFKNAGHNNNNKRKKNRTIWFSNDFFIFLKISFQAVSFLQFLISKKKIGFNDHQCFLFVSLSPLRWSFDVMFLCVPLGCRIQAALVLFLSLKTPRISRRRRLCPRYSLSSKLLQVFLSCLPLLLVLEPWKKENLAYGILSWIVEFFLCWSLTDLLKCCRFQLDIKETSCRTVMILVIL